MKNERKFVENLEIKQLKKIEVSSESPKIMAKKTIQQQFLIR